MVFKIMFFRILQVKKKISQCQIIRALHTKQTLPPPNMMRWRSCELARVREEHHAAAVGRNLVVARNTPGCSAETSVNNYSTYPMLLHRCSNQLEKLEAAKAA